MRNFLLYVPLFFLGIVPFVLFSQEHTDLDDWGKLPEGYQVKLCIDNNGYWMRMARYGLAELNPYILPEPAEFKGSSIQARSVTIEDSPDILVTTESGTQSENSVFVNPEDMENILNSNNSTSGGGGLYGADGLFSLDAGSTWDGSIQGTGGTNFGDPSVAIGNNGWYYNGFINTADGQSCAYSSNQGETWTAVMIAPKPSTFGVLDKNHLMIDNSLSSPYEGNLYSGWYAAGGVNDGEIEIARSTDGGLTWLSAVVVSTAINAGSHNQGVNIQTGPDGEVYAVWAVYDSYPADEKALGFAKSINGGASFQTASRIINNIKGIRNTTAGKNQRVNSFPSMAVDVSDGDYSGNIYIVWPNVGVPGTNTGNDVSVYMIKSTNGGTTWSSPIKINQDAAGNGKKHYFPWITCDPETGTLSVIFYDDRNVSASQVETWVANSMDGGETWEDFRVSDVAFTPAPIPGLAGGYMGDYLAISARDGMVYPCWTDNRTGTAMTYVSPFSTPAQPKAAKNPVPVDGLNNVLPFTSLHWTDPNNRSNYFRLYVGTDNPPTNMINGLILQDTFYTPGSDFDYQEQYFWKIKSYNSCGDAESATWSFTVEAEPDEDFETGNFLHNDWTFGGNANWIIDDDHQVNGVYAARSGTISDGQSTSLKIELEVKFSPFASSISFWKKVSSQLGSDKLQFLIDDDVIDEWSGVSDWSEESFFVLTGGFHTFEWKYTKDNAQSAGMDAAWIDYIRFPLLEQLTANAGPNATICQGSSHMLSGHANNQISVLWTSSGDGSFDDPISLGTDYTPGSSDISAGLVTLTLTAYDESDEVSDQMDLSIQGSPVIEMEESYSICMNESWETQEITAGNYASLLWSTDGDGFFEDNDLLLTQYTPGPGDIQNGTVNLSLSLVGLYPCGAASDTMTLNINRPPLPANPPAGPEVLCQNAGPAEYTINQIPGASEYQWSLIPVEAGTITFNDTLCVVEWSESFWGTAQITVYGINECGEGQTADPLMIAIDPLAEKPATPTGDTYVCVNFVSSSDYTTTGSAYANTYEWSVLPEEAGTISGDATTATVSWNQWEGTALIKVRGLNDCGEGTWSETIEVTTDLCIGIPETDGIGQISVIPNPNNGTFTLKINALQEQNISLRLLNPLNAVVYEQKNIHWSGYQEHEINLQDISKGSYLLYIDNGRSVVVVKVMIR